MADKSTLLVVLIDADDVKYVFPAWPDHICLAACLTRDGDCSMVIFCRDERTNIPQRLLNIFDVGGDEVCFVPQVRGFATRHFRYSDERRLMALVASDPDLLDEAIDYSINYTFALEEGLDPEVVLGLKPETVTAALRPAAVPTASRPCIEPTTRRELSPLLPDFLRRSAEGARRPKFASVRNSKLGMHAALI